MLVVAAGVIALALLAMLLFKAVGPVSVAGTLKSAMLLGAVALIGNAVLDGSWLGNDSQRRSVESRAAELTARAIAPGSSLACLDMVSNADVEAACEKGVFSSAESIAAAIAYVDARISLLSAAAAVAERDPSFRPWFERARRGMEGDRFGLVAHVLVTRGCQSTTCTDLKLLRDTAPVLANMRRRTFESHVAMHAAAWQELATAQGSLGPMFAPPPAGSSSAGRGSPPGKNFYPSSASIPALNIMKAEPGLAGQASDPPAERDAQEPRVKAASVKRSPPARKQTAETPGSGSPMLLPPPPPMTAPR